MSQTNATTDRRHGRPHPRWAWMVIVLAATGIAVRQTSRSERTPRRGARRLERAIAEMQGKYLLGVAEWPLVDRAQLLEQAQAFDAGPPLSRFRFVVIIGELAGPDAAIERLMDYEKQPRAARWSADERRVEKTLRRLYRDQAAGRLAAPSLGRHDRRHLEKRLGWNGRLALHPADGPEPDVRQALLASAQRTALALVAGVAALALAGVVGLAALLAFAALLLSGKLQRPLAAPALQGGIYAETFAIWLVLFVVLASLPDLWMATGLVRPMRHSGLLVQGGAMLLSLTALLWPVWRGLPWPTVREEIGWTLGRRPLIEVLLGGATYVAAIPLLFLGLIGAAILLSIERLLPGSSASGALDPTTLPSHPIIEWVTRGGAWGRLQVVLIASVVAPLVEETMFRGVLYRHLRDATGGRLGFGFSVFVSGAAVSFVFAAIHPQGWVAIPALMSLAFAFALAREWRGTLVPAVIAHGLNNGLVTWLLFRLVGP